MWPRCSASYIARIQTPRYRGVSGPLDDRPPVGKQRHLVRFVPELQNEIVVSDYRMWLKSAVHLTEINRALPLMDLHGIPAAQRDVRATLASEMDEIAFGASAAVGAVFRGRDFRVFIGPQIERQEGSTQVRGRRSTDNQLQCFCRGDGSHHVDRRI